MGGKARFFVFAEPPDPKQMIRVTGPTPVPRPKSTLDPNEIIDRVYRHTLSREPIGLERRQGAEMIKESGADGLEDLLWILFLSPEFQFLR